MSKKGKRGAIERKETGWGEEKQGEVKVRKKRQNLLKHLSNALMQFCNWRSRFPDCCLIPSLLLTHAHTGSLTT